MKDVEKILRALKVFYGNSTILYDTMSGEIVTFQDVIDYVVHLQSENERLNDMKFTQEHCNLYEENKWLKQTIGGYVADQEVWISGYQGTQKENEQLKAEIERMTEDRTQDVKATLKLIKENVSLKKQLEDMEEQRDRQAYIAEDLIQEKHRWTEQSVKDTADKILHDATEEASSIVNGELSISISKLEEICNKIM